MIRLTPWPAGGGELMARPRSRAHGERLGRLTAPTHRAWFWVALWTALAATASAALGPVLDGHGPPIPLHAVLHTLGGASFAAFGLHAWRRRADSSVGRLLTVAGLGILASSILRESGSSAAFTLDLLFGELWIALFAMLILSFVTGGRLLLAPAAL